MLARSVALLAQISLPDLLRLHQWLGNKICAFVQCLNCEGWRLVREDPLLASFLHPPCIHLGIFLCRTTRTSSLVSVIPGIVLASPSKCSNSSSHLISWSRRRTCLIEKRAYSAEYDLVMPQMKDLVNIRKSQQSLPKLRNYHCKFSQRKTAAPFLIRLMIRPPELKNNFLLRMSSSKCLRALRTSACFCSSKMS